MTYRFLLSILTAIFAFRVGAQYILFYFDIPLLPPFELWHSNALQYPTLLNTQIILLLLMASGIFLTSVRKPRPFFGKLFIIIGTLYLNIMFFRMIVGVFDLSEHSWFDGAISTAFHFCLAAYLFVFGKAISENSTSNNFEQINNIIKYSLYPVLLISGYLMFVWLQATGSPLLFASYLVVLMAVVGIILHESFLPHRNEWRPTSEEIVQDGLFLLFIQITLPALLKAGALALIIVFAEADLGVVKDRWPHDWPILSQVAIMLIIAEFFRYWFHRYLHKNKRLWKLHAVHHAAEKLYTINVGRFHPLDKTIQFLGDSLPFLLLGVSAEVFATYFVLYAINGFYQHSNADVRLGILNWLIAGPELHRWHHSEKISEAHHNFGNNLILWDTIFNTRYLPVNQQVGDVGIGNKNWPSSFLSQLAAPFTTRTEKSTKASTR